MMDDIDDLDDDDAPPPQPDESEIVDELDDDELDDGDLDDGDDLDYGVSAELMAAVLSDPESLVTVHEAALDPQLIAEEEYIEAYKDVLTFFAKYRKPMTITIFKERWPDLAVDEEYRDVEYILRDIYRYAKQRLIGKIEKQVNRSLDENINRDENLDNVVELWRAGLGEYGRIFVSQSDRVSPFDGEEFLAHYLKKAEGQFEGISIPFEEMREDINSFEWGHITGIFARPGAKKTFLLAFWLTWVAINQGINVLLYSSEMGKTELEERIIGMSAQVNYDDLTKGKLTQDEFNKMKDYLLAGNGTLLRERLFVAGPTSVRTLADLEIYCGEKNVRVLGIDNAHTIQAEGKDLPAQMNNLMMSMKLMAHRQKMHIVYTTHQNRYGGRGMAGMAYGDAFNTWSSNLFNLKPYNDNIIEISTPKVRNGRGSMEYKIEFNLYKGIIRPLGRHEMTRSDDGDADDIGEF